MGALRKLRRLYVGFTISACILVSGADAARFSSSKGFSFDPPGGWIVATKELRDEIAKTAGTLLPKVKELDFDRIAVAVFNLEEDSFAESINVVVTPGRMPIEEEGVERKLADALTSQYTDAGIVPNNLLTRRRTFGKHHALTASYEATLDGIPVRQLQAMIPGKRQTYIITCSAMVAEFEKFEPVFEEAIRSFEFDTGLGGFPKWAEKALIGAVVGGLIGLFGSLFRRRHKGSVENSGMKKAE